MSNNSILTLREVYQLIEGLKAFDVNDYVIATEDGKHKLDIKPLLKLPCPLKMFIVDGEKQFIHFEFTNGQSISLNKQHDDWIIEDRRSKGVYLIASDSTTKIGVADDPKKRLRGLQTGSPVTLKLIGFWECKNPLIIEKELHYRYNEKRVNGEWFKLSKKDISDIKEYLKNVDGETTQIRT